MATLTIRVDEGTRQDLEMLARGRGQNLSDLIRSSIDHLLAREPESSSYGTPPPSLTIIERQTLALLHRIMADLTDDEDPSSNREHHLRLVEVLEQGFVREYYREFEDLRAELSPEDCQFVVDVLDLFRLIYYSLEELGVEPDSELARRLRFAGFDCNDRREGHMHSYVEFLFADGRWEELKPTFDRRNGGGRAISPQRGIYQRMLDAYREVITRVDLPLGAPEFLSEDELRCLVEAQIHPDNRGRR